MAYQVKLGDKVVLKSLKDAPGTDFWKECSSAKYMIKGRKESDGHSYYIQGSYLEIDEVRSSGDFHWICRDPNGKHLDSCSGHYLRSEHLKLLSARNSNSDMSLITSFKTAFLKEPEKSFRKAGITDNDGLLTDEGQSVFLGFLLGKHGEEFKTEVVDPILKEQEDEK